MIRVSRQTYRAAWLLVVVVLVAGWIAYGMVHHPGKGFLITMVVFTILLAGGTPALLRQSDSV